MTLCKYIFVFTSKYQKSMKTLCEHKKKLPENIAFFVEQAQSATHICGKCGRLAKIKDMVCKPIKI